MFDPWYLEYHRQRITSQSLCAKHLLTALVQKESFLLFHRFATSDKVQDLLIVDEWVIQIGNSTLSFCPLLLHCTFNDNQVTYCTPLELHQIFWCAVNWKSLFWPSGSNAWIITSVCSHSPKGLIPCFLMTKQNIVEAVPSGKHLAIIITFAQASLRQCLYEFIECFIPDNIIVARQRFVSRVVKLPVFCSCLFCAQESMSWTPAFPLNCSR